MKRYKIGYTTGVYDMFHIGHLNILKRAKEQFDFLIVGVSVDSLVEEYKGKSPVITYAERAAIVEAIRYVDRVVPQTDLNKLSAWKQYRFDVLLHGSDWQNSELYNHIIADLQQVGVDTVFLPHTPGISSSGLVEKINEQKSLLQ